MLIYQQEKHELELGSIIYLKITSPEIQKERKETLVNNCFPYQLSPCKEDTIPHALCKTQDFIDNKACRTSEGQNGLDN